MRWLIAVDGTLSNMKKKMQAQPTRDDFHFIFCPLGRHQHLFLSIFLIIISFLLVAFCFSNNAKNIIEILGFSNDSLVKISVKHSVLE